MWKSIFKHLENSTEEWLSKIQQDSKREGETLVSHGPLKKEYLQWGKSFLKQLHEKNLQQELEDLSLTFFTFLSSFGVPEETLKDHGQALLAKDTEALNEDLVLVYKALLGWSASGKDEFVESLKELDLESQVGKNPLLYLIATSSLSWGYHTRFCKNETTADGPSALAIQWLRSSLSPMAFIGLMVLVSALIYFNYVILKEKNIEAKVSEIFQSFLSADIFVQAKAFWQEFEKFMESFRNESSEVREATPSEAEVESVHQLD